MSGSALDHESIEHYILTVSASDSGNPVMTATATVYVNVKDINGETAFHLACKSGQSKTAEVLIKKSLEFKIQLNVKDAIFGKTAFHFACIMGKTTIVKIMIENSEPFRLDLRLKDNDGKTGFQLAKKYKQMTAFMENIMITECD